MYVHIGEVLKYIREEQGLTQTMLADCVGIQRKTVGRIEELEVVPNDGKGISKTIRICR